MGRLLLCLLTIAMTGCGQRDRQAGTGASSNDPRAEEDSLRAWARNVETAFDRFEGCDGGDTARSYYAADSVLFTSDSATTVIDGQAFTALFRNVACTRRESTFRLDSIIVRSLGPGVGVVAATYLETATDTANVTTRLRGAVQWIVRRGPTGWKSPAVSMTEHRSPGAGSAPSQPR